MFYITAYHFYSNYSRKFQNNNLLACNTCVACIVNDRCVNVVNL